MTELEGNIVVLLIGLAVGVLWYYIGCRLYKKLQQHTDHNAWCKGYRAGVTDLLNRTNDELRKQVELDALMTEENKRKLLKEMI